MARNRHFPTETFVNCPLQTQCTTSNNGRSVSLHPDEAFLQELRERQAPPKGRAKLRERVGVAHALAHIGAWQGDRARYRTLRKNLFDSGAMPIGYTRRCARAKGNYRGCIQ